MDVTGAPARTVGLTAISLAMTGDRPATIEAARLDLLADPLAWFFAEHLRHRQMCACLEDVAADPGFNAERVGTIIEFLAVDLPLHILDEEEDLFPLLYRRSLPEDDLDQILGVLSSEHTADLDEARDVRELLERALDRREGLEPDQRKTLVAFARQERCHLAIENAVVLPIARLRLSEDDLANLSQRLAARRDRKAPAPGL